MLWVPACAVTFSAKLHLNMFDLCLGFVVAFFFGGPNAATRCEVSVRYMSLYVSTRYLLELRLMQPKPPKPTK